MWIGDRLGWLRLVYWLHGKKMRVGFTCAIHLVSCRDDSRSSSRKLYAIMAKYGVPYVENGLEKFKVGLNNEAKNQDIV